MSVNARVQAIKVLVTCRLIFVAVILKKFLQNKARISRLVNSEKITKVVEVVTDLIGTSIIGESRSRHMLFNLTLPLTYFTKRKTYCSSVFTFPLFFVFRSNNNRRFNNNYNQRGGGGEHFQQRGGDFSRGGGSDYNNHNNNNRYQNGDSERGGNWNNRGGSRTFSRSSGADNRFAGQGAPPQQQQPQPENGAAPEQPQDEPVNTRWQEPPQQDNYYNNRSAGAGYGGKWNSRGGEVDYTVPLPRDERVEQELFGTDNTGINFNKYEDIPVEATGKDVPEHIASFEDCKLTDIIRENVKMARYDKPTPVQKYAIPIILGGRDLMSCAQTGSG